LGFGGPTAGARHGVGAISLEPFALLKFEPFAVPKLEPFAAPKLEPLAAPNAAPMSPASAASTGASCEERRSGDLPKSMCFVPWERRVLEGCNCFGACQDTVVDF
jgi:hypothetical protein